MKTKYFILILFSTVYVNIFSQTSTSLNKFLSKDKLKHAAVSFKLVELPSGRTIEAFNENMSLTPASNMKLVTTAAALLHLGEEFEYRTPLLVSGNIVDSVLTGNIYIEGVGDPTIGSECLGNDRLKFLHYFAGAVKDKGIKKVRGDVVVLDQLFGYEGVSGKWLLEDIGNYYAPGVYGISFFDNTYRLTVQPDKDNSRVNILYSEPEIDGLYFVNNLTVTDSDDAEAYIFGTPFVNERLLYGSVSANKTDVVLKGDIPDPGLLLARFFKNTLIDNGIRVEGEATTFRLQQALPIRCDTIAIYHSLPLSSIVRETNVKSNNHYAEHLYSKLTKVEGLRLRTFFQQLGLDSTALIMYDGSGLSPQNALSARYLTDLLVLMDKQTGGNKRAFYASLPVVGREGTVSGFMKNTALAGRMRLKSGSMSGVLSYSGYVETGGKRYAVSLIINNFDGKLRELRKEVEEFFNEVLSQ